MHKLTTYLLAFVLAFLAGQPILFGQEEPDEITDRLIPFTELDTPAVSDPCVPLTAITAKHIINFESASMLYFRAEAPDLLLSGGNLMVSNQADGAIRDVPVVSLGEYMRAELEPGQDYWILALNSCDELQIVEEVSTIPKGSNEAITVSQGLGVALSDWKMAEQATDLYDYLNGKQEVSPYEKNEFLQNFVSDGALLSDAYLYTIDIPRDAFTPIDDPIDPNGGGGTPPTEDCTCRVIEIIMVSAIYPTSSSQSNPTIHPLVFPNTVIRETNRIKFWHAGSFEGPARYQQIWGETKRCRNVTETAVWGDNSNHPLSSALGRADIRVEQICKSGNWDRGDCYCTQDLTFKYRYDAQLDARSSERGGWCFNPPGKKAQGIVDDAVIVMVARRNDPSDPSSAEPVYYDMAARGAVSTCNKDFQEKRLIDVFKLGLSVYAYIKGLPINIPDPTISDVGNLIWDEYQKSLFFSALNNLLTEPWVTGSCTQVTTNYSLNKPPVSLQLDGKDALIFTLTASSYLEVNGMTAWDANARVLSGFSMSVLLEKNENVGQDNAYCCTKPAGIYQTSTLHPIHGPNTYSQTIGFHFASNFPNPNSPTGQTPINQDRDIIVGNQILNCETTVNGRSLDVSDPFALPARPMKIMVMDGMILGEGLQREQVYQAELFSLDGRMLMQNVVSGPETILFEQPAKRLNTGVYIVRLHGAGDIVTQKVFLP